LQCRGDPLSRLFRGRHQFVDPVDVLEVAALGDDDRLDAHLGGVVHLLAQNLVVALFGNRLRVFSISRGLAAASDALLQDSAVRLYSVRTFLQRLADCAPRVFQPRPACHDAVDPRRFSGRSP